MTRLLNTSTNNIKINDPIIIELLAKCSNFQNVFSKTEADKLPKNNKHNMLIDFENKKMFFIGLVYNMSRLGLQAIHKYIDKMLAKSFIIPFKLPIRAFTKKENSELYFCIDYCSVITITKKNKYLILLVYSLLNILGKT